MSKRTNIIIGETKGDFSVIWQAEDLIKKDWRKSTCVYIKCNHCWEERRISIFAFRRRWAVCSLLRVRGIKTHWLCKTRIHGIRTSMKNRCNNKGLMWYHLYWWRWIKYDPKREKFEWFYEDMKDWYKDGLSIDRIDNNWNYCKENCRWTTILEQSKNRRSNIIMDNWMCQKDYCEYHWVDYAAFRHHFKQWRKPEDIVTFIKERKEKWHWWFKIHSVSAAQEFTRKRKIECVWCSG